jgi:hypothetical protein
MFTPERAEDLAAEYAGSFPFSLLADELKEGAPALCAEFLRRAAEPTEAAVSRVMLEEIPALALAVPLRDAAPDVLRGFLEWLQDSGRLGEGYSLGRFVAAAAPAYRDRCAPKATPIINKTTKIGRNDPCPCGSGRKYKKCCAGGQ